MGIRSRVPTRRWIWKLCLGGSYVVRVKHWEADVVGTDFRYWIHSSSWVGYHRSLG